MKKHEFISEFSLLAISESNTSPADWADSNQLAYDKEYFGTVAKAIWEKLPSDMKKSALIAYQSCEIKNVGILSSYEVPLFNKEEGMDWVLDLQKYYACLFLFNNSTFKVKS